MVRRCATLAAFLMVSLLFLPFVQAGQERFVFPANRGASTDSAAAVSRSDSSSLPNGPTDSPGGPSPAPGVVNAQYLPASPTLSETPPPAAPPQLNVSADEYRYSTAVGEYVIPRSLPFLLGYASPAGDVLVAASSFLVIAPGVTPFADPIVLNATAESYQMRYNLTAAGTPIGNVTLSYLFGASRPPKISAKLDQSSGPPLALTWIALTLDGVVANRSTALNFSSLIVPTPAPVDGFQTSVGPGQNRTNWTRRVTFDWSDAGAGTAFAGHVAVGHLSGAAFLVRFPVGMKTVDPTVVGSTTTIGATDYSIQRKTFAYGSWYWAFWYDGSNIMYAASRDGVAWSAAMSTGSGAIAAGYSNFDVDQRGGTVLVGFVPSNLTALHLITGTITGGFIRWWGSYWLASWSTAGAGPVTVTIGADGYYWAAVLRWETSTQSKFYVYRSNYPYGTTFFLTLSDVRTLAPSDSYARILGLPNGALFLLLATRTVTTLRGYVYGAGGWSSPFDYSIGHDATTTQPYYLMSCAVLPPTDRSSLQILVAYRHSSGGLYFASLDPSGLSYSYGQVDSRDAWYPATSVDSNGDPHLFWASAGHVYYSRWLPASKVFTGATEPFAFTGYGRYGLTAIPTSAAQVALIWTEYPGAIQVMFAALATPENLGSQTGNPWNRQGLSPYESYFQQMSEYVSPGSGLLTVKQTDLSLPGRGLDLALARVYTTPRAFMTAGGSPAPYLYEAYPAANLGAGWALNFPWISNQYIHLWDGQMYVFNWAGDTAIENHDGEHFVVKWLYRSSCDPSCYVYVLYTKTGITYEFDMYNKLRYIKDPSGNKITLNYNGNTLANITDTIARKVQFSYAGGLLTSASTGLQTVAYGYQTVGGLSVLASVTDSLGRVTRFDNADARTPYLLTGVTYPTGGKGAYSWSNPAAQVGPDLVAYYVTKQEALNSAGQSVRANQLSYQVVNGQVSYVNAVDYDTGVEKGCTVELFDSLARKSVSVVKAAPCDQPGTGSQLEKEVSWFDPSGGVSQVDVYPGASTSPAYSTYTAYDDWGNMIYTRDAVGHERFASFVNTRYQGGFYSPGRLTRTVNGLLLFDDFEGRDLSSWILDTTAGTVGLDYSTFATVPPALKVAHTGATSGVAAATHTFAAQSGYFVVEAYVRPEETNRQHYVLLRTSASAIRAYVSFRDNGWISWYSGTTWTDLTPYQAKQWYRIAFQLSASGSGFSIWVNDLGYAGNLVGSGNIDRINFQASCSGCGSATMYVDMVKVYQTDGMTVQGLQAGQVVALESSSGGLVDLERVSSGSTSVTVASSPGLYPYATIQIYDTEGFVIYTSPTHDFWGGDTWAFTQPWKSFPIRTRSGFLRSTSVHVDDALPTGAVPHSGGEIWSWSSYDVSAFGFPVSGSLAHESTLLSGIHQHFFDSATSQFSPNSGDFLIQYVDVPGNEYPAELMLQFHDVNGGGWEHRAYWGANIIPWGTDGSSSRLHIGDLPAPPGRWLMFIVRADDVGTAGRTLDGLAYTLYGGMASWDYSARGDSATGQIRIDNLQANWKAELYDSKGAFVASATVPTGATSAILDVYGAATKISTFPFDGYFLIRDGSTFPLYRSPVMSFWGGDVFGYSSSNFYPNGNIAQTIHDRLAGTLEFQTGRGAAIPIPHETYLRYPEGNVAALPDRMKVRDGSSWRETALGFDQDGLLSSTTDPKGNVVSYSYSATYSRAYVTQVSDSVGIRSRDAYDPTTGWLLAEKDGRGYMTRFAYDLLGRQTEESRYDLPPAFEVLHFDMDWTTEEASPRMEDLSGHSNHGSIFGTAIAAGRVGMARDFRGSGSYLQAADSATLDISGNQITLAAWVYPKSNSASSVILNKEGSYEIGLNNGVFQAAVETSASGSWAWGGTQTVPLNTWTHVAFAYESGSTWKFYLNGVLRETIPPANGQTGNVVSSTYALRVGDRTSSSTPFVGLIDEVRVFNVALNATNIGALSTNGYGRISSRSIAYDDIGNAVTAYEPTTKPRTLHYDMETMLNGRMEDLSGRGGSGTLFGTASMTGRVGLARSFGGNGDRVQGPNLDVGTTFSVSLWVNPNSSQVDGEGVLVKKDYTFSITLTSSRVVNAYIYNGASWQIVSSNASLPAGTWTHVAVTYSASGGNTATYLYLNGAKDNAKTLTGLAAASSNPIMMGALTSTFQRLNGAADEVQLFDRALSATEVSQLYLGTEKGFYDKQYFDSLGRTTRTVRRDFFQALVSWETIAYNFRDQITSRTVARNSSASFTTTYGYDFLGRPTSVTYPGTAPPVTISYDDLNRIRTVFAENWREVQYLYDVGGRMTKVREYYDATNNYTTSNAYDEVGNVLSVSNALGQVTQHQYDNLNRLTKTIYPDTTKYETYTYDEVGNLNRKTDRAGQVTTYGYDARYRMITVDYSSTTPNPDVGYVYDLNDNPTTVTNYATNPATTVAYVYDGIDRATNETDTIAGASYGVGYSYDSAGRLTKLVYPDNSAITYLYDSLGRTSQVMDASATYASFAYAADDLMNNVTFGNGVVQSYAYNGRGWPTSIKATYGQTTYLNLGYAYDNSGNVLTMGSATFTYDKLDRLLTGSGGFGSQSYTYDAIGNRLQLDRNTTTVVLRPNGAGSTTQWTPVGCTQNWQCVSEATSDGDTTRVETSTVGNVDAYAFQDLTQTSGTVVSVTVTAVARFYAGKSCRFFPELCGGHLSLQVNGYSGSAQALSGGYQAISQTWTTNPATGQAWTIGQVNALQAGVHLDDIGNISRVTQVYVSVVIADRTTYLYANGATGMDTLTSLSLNGGAATTFGYDANGNLLSKFGSSKACYAWNPENLLTQVKSASSACTDTGSQIQAYTYDGLGRRVKVDGTSSSTWTVTIYSGKDAIYEKDQSGAITEYVYANGMRIAKITSSGVQYYLSDHLGSTRKILDSSRNTVFSTDYEPFGKPYAPSGTEAYKFASEKHDDPTGLVYLRARQYDPDLGRFVSADPVLGSLSRPQTQDRYAYVANNPLRYRDSSGRFLEAITDWWNGLSPEQKGLVIGIVAAIAVTAACLTVIACVPAIGVVGVMLASGAASAGAYAAGTVAFGGTPTVGGALIAFGAGVAVSGLIMTGVGEFLGPEALLGGGAEASEGGLAGGAAAAAEEEATAGIPDDAIAAAADGGVREIDFAPGGREAALEGRPLDVLEEQWLQGVKDIANEREGAFGAFNGETFPNVFDPGTQKYGYIWGDFGTLYHVAVNVGEGGITDAYVYGSTRIPYWGR